MAVSRVKHKFHLSSVLAILAALTFALSWASMFPSKWVEKLYSRGLFPTISHIVGRVGDAVSFSWLDVAATVAVLILVYSVYSRKVRAVIGAVSAGYLWFFWSWGLNYHRVPLETRMELQSSDVSATEVEQLAATAASELNRLWPAVSKQTSLPDRLAAAASAEVRKVTSRLDGSDGFASGRIKNSLIANGWFRMATVDGVFNPFGHEAIVASDLLPFELPFIMAHEFAHVRGVPHEGEANLVALLATLTSPDVELQYSGWLQLWPYLHNRTRERLLGPGPKQDLQSMAERVRAHRVAWASNLQAAVLDWHLKANNVPDGVDSYAQLVTLAIAAKKRGLWTEGAMSLPRGFAHKLLESE